MSYILFNYLPLKMLVIAKKIYDTILIKLCFEKFKFSFLEMFQVLAVLKFFITKKLVDTVRLPIKQLSNMDVSKLHLSIE